jgi:hypothetical protein
MKKIKLTVNVFDHISEEDVRKLAFKLCREIVEAHSGQVIGVSDSTPDGKERGTD